MKKFFILLILLWKMISSIAQTCNPLDATFGTAGKAVGSHNSYWVNGRNLILQPDNKIIQICITDGQFVAIRYNSDGSLDNTFGTNGKATTALNMYTQHGALQSDGKIVVTGYRYNQNYTDIVVVRFNSNGSLDNSFGTSGMVTFLGDKNDLAYGVAIQPDGKILIVGSTEADCYAETNCYGYNFCKPFFTILRYNNNGTLDNTFGQNGKVITNLGPEKSGRASTIALQPDGKIVVAGESLYKIACDDYYGYAYYASNFFSMVRYNSNGQPDLSFGKDGVVADSLNMLNCLATAIQADGKIVVVGDARQGGSMVVRYNTDGNTDNSFDQDGKVIISGAWLNSMIPLSDGKIALAGSGGDVFFVCRLESNGGFDNSFNNTGKLYFHPGDGSAYDNGSGIALQGDKLIIGGTSQYSQGNVYYYDAIVVRLGTTVSGLLLNVSPQGIIYPCQTESVTLSVTQVGTYQWYKNGVAISNATSSSISVTSNGNYTVSVINGNECGRSEPIHVIYNGLPVSIIPASSLNICVGQSVNLQSSESGTIQWFKDGILIPGATNTTYTAGAEGSYYVFVKNSKGCGQSSSVYVNVNSDKPSISWNGTTLNTDWGYYSYQWYLNGNAIAGANSVSIQPTQTGVYKVVIADYGCNSTSNEFTIDCVLVAVSKPSVFWNGTQLISSPSSYAGYQWYLNGNAVTGANASSFTPIQTGIYKVTVTGKFNCTNTSNEFTFDCNAAVPKPSIVWNGTQLTSNPSSYATYQWHLNGNAIAGANASSFTPVQTGIYKVTATGNFNCTHTSTDFNFDCSLVNPNKPVVDWNGSQFSTASVYVSYQWYKDDVVIAGATSNTYTPVAGQFGMYKVAVTGNYNCNWTSDAKPYQFTAVSDIVIGDATLRYYPNPANNTIYIDIPRLLNKKMTVIMSEITGRKLIQQSLIRGQNQVPVEKFPSGLYQLQIQYGSEKIALKIVLLK